MGAEVIGMGAVDRKVATVLAIESQTEEIAEIFVDCDGSRVSAVAFPSMTGEVAEGDSVLLNVTAVSLGLGSGGRHFVMANLSRPLAPRPGEGDAAPTGHIMKLRYTPLQCRTLSVGEEGSPHRDALESFRTMDGAPVIIGQLHSMVAPVCAALGELSGGSINVVYIMTDGACLPAAFSRTAQALRERGLIRSVVSCGHAFGGEVEALSKHSALAAASAALKADVVVVAMGVGVAGTGTTLDNTAIEAGEWVNAAASLGGTPIFIPRISFADKRDRHQGVSHHTVTALNVAALARAIVAIPQLPDEQAVVVDGDLKANNIGARHELRVADGTPAIDGMKNHNLRITTMGRGVEEERPFFLACGAAAGIAFDIVDK